uniref:Uncharacterized protein n=1 Tax=Caenorhabditis japonica TaxID=281687 RepID=A0A8R1E6X8_CAEJA
MVRGMVGRGKKKEKNGVPPPPLPPQPHPQPPPNHSNSNTKHARMTPSFSCSPPVERKDSRPAPVQITSSEYDQSVGSPPARRQPPKRVPSGKSSAAPPPSGVVHTDLAM